MITLTEVILLLTLIVEIISLVIKITEKNKPPQLQKLAVYFLNSIFQANRYRLPFCYHYILKKLFCQLNF